MLRSSVLIALWLASSPGLLAAQPAAPDPITGLWGTRESAGLDLKYDGGRAVTGTIYITGRGSAPITSGSFDPQTRTLKVSGRAPADGGALEPFTVDGTLEGDVLSLNFAFGAHNGSASFRRAGAPAPSSPIVTDPVPALRKTFADASGWVTKAAEAVPAEKYSYRPATTVRSFGEIVAHVADAYNFSCGQAAGRKVEWSPAIENSARDKAAIVAKLKEATAGCEAVYAGTGSVDALIENVAHTNLHYGNLVTYMRMLNLVPPSSAR